jgi:fatty-acyl-CoA synthase
LSIGVKRGDKVAIFMSNRLEWVYCHLAVAKVGAVLVCINTHFKSEELAYSLRRSDVSALVLENTFLGKIDALAMAEELCPELSSCEPGALTSERLPFLKNVICLGEKKGLKGAYAFDAVVEQGISVVTDGQLDEAMSAVKPDDPYLHLLTSGTTGLPKAAESPHRESLRLLHWGALPSPRGLGLTEDDRVLGVMSFTGGAGTGQMPMCIIVGATLVILEAFDAGEVLKAIERERITATTLLVPTMVRMMLESPDFSKYDISSFKRTYVGGAPVTRDLFELMRDKMGMEVVLSHYGMVESYGPVVVLGPGDSEDQIINTVGYPLPHILVKIIDPNTGEKLAPEQEGEICLKGAWPEIRISSGYYNNPEKTAELIDKDGWLHMGDVGQIRKKDGYLKVTGRIKDMVIVGGYNVYPAEVEQTLVRHPAVNEVAVVGVPDKRLGEVPMAFVQLRDGETCSENDITEFCRSRISGMKVPKYVQFVDEFPLTLQGKIQKFKMRDTAIREMRLE